MAALPLKVYFKSLREARQQRLFLLNWIHRFVWDQSLSCFMWYFNFDVDNNFILIWNQTSNSVLKSPSTPLVLGGPNINSVSLILSQYQIKTWQPKLLLPRNTAMLQCKLSDINCSPAFLWMITQDLLWTWGLAMTQGRICTDHF